MAKNMEFIISGDLFKGFRENFDLTLEEVIEDMIAKGCPESSITAKVDILLVPNKNDLAPNSCTPIGNCTFIPRIEHTIASAMTVKSKRKGMIGNNLKMSYDEKSGRWVCMDADSDQTSFVSADGDVIEADGAEIDDDDDFAEDDNIAALPGAKTLFLPDNREAGN